MNKLEECTFAHGTLFMLPSCNITMCYFVLLYVAQNITITIEAWDRQGCGHNEIDFTATSFPLSANTQGQTIQKLGENEIGLFNFTYNLRDLVEAYGECLVEEHIPPTDISTYTSSTDNSTCQQAKENSTSPWTWIALSIVLMLLTTVLSVVIISLALVVRQKNQTMKKMKSQCTCRNTSATSGKHT